MNVKLLFCFVLGLFQLTNGMAQSNWYNQQWDRGQIDLELKKLSNSTKVLYIAAHPDDENTRLISYLENVHHIDVAYLSLTNGSGGQNLIGSELGEDLGLIREQELYAARRQDGGEQFFTSALDFGYSKTHEETFKNWDKDQVLSEVVYTIRKFRPDVIITRFAPYTEGLNRTHGHHTASAILAKEAFALAGDKTKYPEQLNEKGLTTWQPQAIYWNSSYWSYGGQDKIDAAFAKNPSKYLKLNVEAMVPELGLTVSEIAARSRSMHKSQGFGSMPRYGTTNEYLELIDGKKNSFQNILKEGARDADLVEVLYSDQNTRIVRIARILKQQALNQTMSDTEIERLKNLYLQCLGARIFVKADGVFIPSGKNELDLELTHFSEKPVQLMTRGSKSELARNIESGVKHEEKLTADFNSPYEKASVSLFINGIQFNIPVVYRTSDPVKGEIIQPVMVTEDVILEIPIREIISFNKSSTQSIVYNLTALKTTEVRQQMGGKYDFWYPAFDTLESAERISRTQRATQGKFSLHLHYGPDTLPLESSIATISYDHIPSIHKFGNDKIEIKSVNASTNAKKVGYVAGAGDKMAEATTSLGAEVEMIDHTTVSVEDLAKFDAVVFGIRALNVHADIDQHIQKFYDYAEAGGTLIMQYNTSHRLKTKNLQGLTLSRDRVTEEVAAVNVINKHQVLAFPNKITTEDWDNWVQERGLYFPNKWDDSFVPILTMNDSGESPKSGSLLIKPMGKGYFVYTGISFFRELPAGVNGAYKLWGNILSLKGN